MNSAPLANHALLILLNTLSINGVFRLTPFITAQTPPGTNVTLVAPTNFFSHFLGKSHIKAHTILSEFLLKPES